jgi:hypothetical protein
VLDDLAENTTVAAADDEDFLGVGVGVERKVSDHLLVAVKFVSPSALTPLHHGGKNQTYANSSRSVHWMTLSRTRTLP